MSRKTLTFTNTRNKDRDMLYADLLSDDEDDVIVPTNAGDVPAGVDDLLSNGGDEGDDEDGTSDYEPSTNGNDTDSENEDDHYPNTNQNDYMGTHNEMMTWNLTHTTQQHQYERYYSGA